MNLFVLLGKAETKLETGDDSYFNEATELVTSRHTATYHEYGFTTKAVGWLDKAVAKGLLLSPYEDKAKGALTLGPLLTTYLDDLLA